MERNSINQTYDSSNPKSIEEYAQKSIGKTFSEVCRENSSVYDVGTLDGYLPEYNGKGNLGQIIEEQFFHYKCNSDSDADFKDAGVELKVTPYKINSNGSISAKERLSLTMINYFDVVNESFEDRRIIR